MVSAFISLVPTLQRHKRPLSSRERARGEGIEYVPRHSQERVSAILRSSLVGIGLAGMLFCALAVQAAGEGSYVVEGSQAAQGGSCVEPTDFMRRNHMEVIKHQRDETVHNGIRSTKHSLAGCIECHVSYAVDNTPVPVNTGGQFCRSCHEFAAVGGMGCFGCHATVPVQLTAETGDQALPIGGLEKVDVTREVEQGVGE